MAKSAASDDETVEEDLPDRNAPGRAYPQTENREKTVTVHCSLASGIQLSINKQTAVTVSEGGDGYRISVPRVVPIKNGINPGISKAFWDEWLAENADYPPVVSSHIFAVEE